MFGIFKTTSTLKKKTTLKAKTVPLRKKKRIVEPEDFDPKIVELDLKFLEERRAKSLLGNTFKIETGAQYPPSVYVSGMNTGCGLAQLSGNTFLSAIKPEDFEKVEKSFEKVKDAYSGHGAILCTLGKTYFKNEENLMKLGFRKIAEYINPGHGAGYTQRLYIYVTEQGRFAGNKDISA